VQDGATSLCIAAGKPTSDFSNEPSPNGSRINIGAFGNTIEASKSSVLSIQEETQNTIVVKPNPTTGMISISEQYLNTRYQITSLIGSVIKEGVIKINSIDFSTFNTGIYYLKIIDSETGKIIVTRVVKE